jgi:hypothetical protein
MRVGRKGKAAITHYRVLERFRGYSWVAFQIETGRTHQIRVHLQNAGHSLDGIRLKGIGTAGPLNTTFFRTTGGKTNVTAEVKTGAVVADEDTGLPHGLGFETIPGITMLMQDNKDRMVFARMTGKG